MLRISWREHLSNEEVIRNIETKRTHIFSRHIGGKKDREKKEKLPNDRVQVNIRTKIERDNENRKLIKLYK